MLFKQWKPSLKVKIHSQWYRLSWMYLVICWRFGMSWGDTIKGFQGFLWYGGQGAFYKDSLYVDIVCKLSKVHYRNLTFPHCWYVRNTLHCAWNLWQQNGPIKNVCHNFFRKSACMTKTIGKILLSAKNTSVRFWFEECQVE